MTLYKSSMRWTAYKSPCESFVVSAIGQFRSDLICDEKQIGTEEKLKDKKLAHHELGRRIVWGGGSEKMKKM